MSLNIGKIVKSIAGPIGLNADSASAIVVQTLSLIDMAEDIYDGLKGSEKLAAVQAGLRSFIEELDPSLVDRFGDIWRALKPAISMIVTIYNAVGIFKKALS